MTERELCEHGILETGYCEKCSETLCIHNKLPCDVCAGLDVYAPTLYEPPEEAEYKRAIYACNASDALKKLCLDGHGCACDMSDAMLGHVTTGDVRLDLGFTQEECSLTDRVEDLEIEIRRMLTAFDAIATIACDMLDPVRRAGPTGKKHGAKKLRGKGMLGLRSSGCDESNAEKEGEIWCI